MHADLYLVEIISSSTLLSVVDIILLILQEAKSPDGGLLLAKNDVDRLALGNENGNAVKALWHQHFDQTCKSRHTSYLSQQRKITDCVQNHTPCVKLHTVCKITHRVQNYIQGENYTLCVRLHKVCKITHCVQNYSLCAKLHTVPKLNTVCKITHCAYN